MTSLLLPDETAKVRTQHANEQVAFVLKRLPSASEMASIAYAGRAKRGWYERSAAALIDAVGPEEAPKFAALVAALSPQTSVASNIATASKAWRLWKDKGSPLDRKSICDILARSVPGAKGLGSVLTSWINNSIAALNGETLSGPKVYSFARNLSGHADEVTNDAWMAAYMNIPQAKLSGSGAAPGKSFTYIAVSIRTREAAAVLSKRTGEEWTPAEVQECVWSFCKALYELADTVGAPSARIIVRDHLTHADVASAPDFATLLGNNAAPLQLLSGLVNDPAAEHSFTRHLDVVAKRLDVIRKARRGGKANPRQYRLQA